MTSAPATTIERWLKTASGLRGSCRRATDPHQVLPPRDVWLFVGFILLIGSIGGLGIAALYIRIRRLRDRRRDLGLDVDIDSDDDQNGPPPGFP
ncbi:MAG: DUF5803 family protein [Natrialbaceae archaeon]|nr:DUF5803 family protein [Natrialbaceae archaeon]